MKFRNTRLSKRTLALLAATAVLFGSGGYMGTRAALEYQSDWAKAEFELEHLQVHLLENGRDVCEGNNSWSSVHRGDSNNGGDSEASEKQAKYVGDLLGDSLGYANSTHDDTAAYLRSDTLGTVEPGRTYDEVIAAQNGSDVDQYLRLTIRKYWVDKSSKRKITKLDPSLIELTFDGKDYNKGPWQINSKEHTSESDTYYYTSILKGRSQSNDGITEPLFNELTISKGVLDSVTVNESVSESTEGNKKTTVYTYTYDYDDCTFYIEADVQAIQTHNSADAVKSLWGVTNVTAKDGRVVVE